MIERKGEPSASGSPSVSLRYLLFEAGLILLFSYLIVAGTDDGLIRFRLQATSFVGLTLLLGGWLALRTWQRARLPRTSLDWPILAWFLACAIAAALSTDPRRSLARTAITLLYILIFFLLVDFLRSLDSRRLEDAGSLRRNENADLLVKSMLIAASVVLILALGDIISWYVQWGEKDFPFSPRINGLLGHANTTAAFLSLLVPLALASLLGARRLLPRVALAIWLLLALVTIFFTSSRGGWLGLLAGLGIFSVLLLLRDSPDPRPLIRRFLRRSSLPIIVLGLPILLGIGWLFLNMAQHPSHDSLFSSRSLYWPLAWQTFLASPFWGVGPYTFSSQYLRHYSIPPSILYVHAHNFYLTIAAEMGLVGLAALAWLLGSLGYALLKAWQRANRQSRLLIAGCIGGLSALAVHQLFDNELGAPAIVITAMALALLALESAQARQVRRTLALGWLAVPALALASFCSWSLAGYWYFMQGVQLAAEERWQESIPWLDRAAQIDPALAFYHLQSGYAHGLLAHEGDKAELEQAIARYETGIRLEPFYSLNHANLAGLYWQAHAPERAIDEMEQAATLAPDEALYPLNLGYYHESLGQEKLAITYYEKFLDSQPRLKDAPFWQETHLRRQALEAWQQAHPALDPDSLQPKTYGEYLQRGWLEMEAGKPQEARQDFGKARDLAPGEFGGYHGLGAAYMALGDYAEADRFLSIAISFPLLLPADKLYPLLDWAELADRQGQADKAAERYDPAFSMVNRYSAFGPGTWGWSPYGWQVFYRESITPDVLPQVIRLDITTDMAERFLRLGELLEERGDKGKARIVYSRLLQAWPDWPPARERLRALSY
jgi:O-antigen ligase